MESMFSACAREGKARTLPRTVPYSQLAGTWEESAARPAQSSRVPAEGHSGPQTALPLPGLSSLFTLDLPGSGEEDILTAQSSSGVGWQLPPPEQGLFHSSEI